MSMDQPPPPPPPVPANYGGGTPQPIANPLIGYWKRVVLERYAQFEGRARRPEYWWYTLANVVIGLLLIVLSAVSSIFVVLLVIFWLALIVPSLAVTVRRLHDSDKSGWFILFGLVPFVGGLILLVFMLLESDPGPNQFGALDAS